MHRAFVTWRAVVGCCLAALTVAACSSTAADTTTTSTTPSATSTSVPGQTTEAAATDDAAVAPATRNDESSTDRVVDASTDVAVGAGTSDELDDEFLLAVTAEQFLALRPGDLVPDTAGLSASVWDRLTPASAPAAASLADGAQFTWRMPERYRASWEAFTSTAGDDGDFAYPDRFVNPDSWRVRLDGCDSTGPTAIATYDWRVSRGGTLIEETRQRVCDVDIEVPDEGDYLVSLTVSGDGWQDTTERVVTVEDLLVVSLGDSSASGEGNPLKAIVPYEDLPTAMQEQLPEGHDLTISYWLSDRCHRAPTSSHAFTAAELEASSPTSSVTFLSFACSGARMQAGVLGPYDGIEPDEDDGQAALVNGELESQLDQLLRALCGRRLDESLDGCSGDALREVDVLLLSIGVNDAYFSDVVKICGDVDGGLLGIGNNLLKGALPFYGDRPCWDEPALTGPVNRYVEDRTDLLTYNPQYVYDDCADAACGGRNPTARHGEVNRRLRHLGLTVDETYLVGYPAEPFKDTSAGCGVLATVDDQEAQWINETGRALAEKLVQEAILNDWEPVVGIPDAFRPASRYGYCGSATRFVSVSESLLTQGDQDGAMHPNRTGHTQIAARVLDAIRTHGDTPPDTTWTATASLERVRLTDNNPGKASYLTADGMVPLRTPITIDLHPVATKEGRTLDVLSRAGIARADDVAELPDANLIRSPEQWVDIDATATATFTSADDHLRLTVVAELPRVDQDGVALRMGSMGPDMAAGVESWLSLYPPADSPFAAEPAPGWISPYQPGGLGIDAGRLPPGGDGTIARPVVFSMQFSGPDSRRITTRLWDAYEQSWLDVDICVTFEEQSRLRTSAAPASCDDGVSAGR